MAEACLVSWLCEHLPCRKLKLKSLPPTAEFGPTQALVSDEVKYIPFISARYV